MAFSTTRAGGASQGPWASFNLGEHSGDSPAAVVENRERLRTALPAEPAWLKQVHGSRVVSHAGALEGRSQADAVVASGPEEVCAILTADCLPVLFADRAGTRVAAAHAGWRGLAAGVLENTVAALGGDPGEMIAWVGPGIGADHYEVGDEVRAAFLKHDAAAASAFARSGDRWLADLPALARQRLAGVGIREVSGGQWCTACEPDRFFSHRRDGQTGRMATLVWIRAK